MDGTCKIGDRDMSSERPRFRIDLIILEDDQAIEEAPPRCYFAEALNFGEGTKLMLMHRKQQLVHRLELLAEATFAFQAHSYRQSAHEWTDDPLSVRKVGRTSRKGSTKNHVGGTRLLPKEQRPGSLNQRAGR